MFLIHKRLTAAEKNETRLKIDRIERKIELDPDNLDLYVQWADLAMSLDDPPYVPSKKDAQP